MRPAKITAEELLREFQVPGATPADPPEAIYVLGSFQRRVTLYSQQVRGLNLSFALFDQQLLAAGARVAVIGAGAAGIAAAAALVDLGARVDLIERADRLLPLQKGCRTRWIHPRIYDWPEPGSEEADADLPLVPWSAGYAHDVATRLEEQFLAATREGVRLTLSAQIQKVTGGPRPAVSWSGWSPAGKKVTKPDQAFDAVLVAVGFGFECGTELLPMASYWRNDDLDQPVMGAQQERIRCLVSGNGDGGLIDVLRLRLRDFRLESLHDQLRHNLKPDELERLAGQLREWEAQAGTQSDTWLWGKYEELDIPETFSEWFKNQALRRDTRVWLASRGSPITFGSAILNRLWVAFLVSLDPETKWIGSATRRVVKQESEIAVEFVEPHAAAGATRFDRVILRHGPTTALASALQWIGDRCRANPRARTVPDETRLPIWRDDTFGRTRAAVARPIGGGPVLVARGTGDAAGIEFLEHCRVDPRSMLTLADGDVPRLCWHATIRRPFELILESGGQLDALVMRLPWFERASERHINVPTFKAAFFNKVTRLVRSYREILHGLGRLWQHVKAAEVEARRDALTTYASLAALKMIARLREFEGTLRTSSGKAIMNLFPDLAPIQSSWLLRRVPYRSRTGGLALDEEQLLLARVGPTEDKYNYVLLPRRISELYQDDRAGLSADIAFRWLVPQWFLQDYAGVPEGPHVVWVLSDELGRERWSATADTPWRGEHEEEKPHPAMAMGAELEEIEPGWHVMTLPFDRPATQTPSTRPLAGRRILWVDDNPHSNDFEVNYLEQLGATVARSASTEQAIAHLAGHEIDLVISDVSRIEMGQRKPRAGVELFERSRREPRAASVPIIFYTANRRSVPDEIRKHTVDQRPALFRAVLAQLAGAGGPSEITAAS